MRKDKKDISFDFQGESAGSASVTYHLLSPLSQRNVFEQNTIDVTHLFILLWLSFWICLPLISTSLDWKFRSLYFSVKTKHSTSHFKVHAIWQTLFEACLYCLQSTFTWFDPLLTAYSSFVHFHCHCYLHLFAFDFHFQNIDEFSFQLTSTKRLQSQAQRSQGGLSTQSLSNTGRWFVEVSFCSIFLFLTEKTWLHWKEIHPCPNPHLVYMNIIAFWFQCHLWIPIFLKIYFLQNVSKHIGCPTDDMNKLVTCLKVLIFFYFYFSISIQFWL